MTPEQQSRQRIDEQLVKCGWVVQEQAVRSMEASR